jgi:hypothetical protein
VDGIAKIMHLVIMVNNATAAHAAAEEQFNAMEPALAQIQLQAIMATHAATAAQ